jgi:low affinity Fe/Cu permease
MTSQKRHSHKAAGLNNRFSQMAQTVATWTGHPVSFLLACAVVLIWIVSGPMFNYSDTWQLVINTGTTIITFLMVFLIQNTQNRDILTVQLKLSELVLAMKGAEDRFAAIEDLTVEELQALHDECKRRAAQTLTHIEQRRDSVPAGGSPKNGTGGNKVRVAAARAKSQRRSAAAH